MAKVSISEAARLVNVSRPTLYTRGQFGDRKFLYVKRII